MSGLKTRRQTIGIGCKPGYWLEVKTMKKLITAAMALAMAAGMASAVESQNIVGYSSITFKDGYNLVGVSFDKVGGGGLDIQDLFEDVVLTGINDDFETFDFMQVWNLDLGGFDAIYSWADNVNVGDTGWYDGNFDYASRTFKPGDAFWIYSSVGGTAGGAVALGEVVATNTPIVIKPGYNMLTNPFPADFDLNAPGSFSATGLVGINDDFETFDFIQVWDLAVGGFTAIYSWADNPNVGDTGWYDGNFDYVTAVSIAPNTAFWLYHNGTGATVTFGSPIAE